MNKLNENEPLIAQSSAKGATLTDGLAADPEYQSRKYYDVVIGSGDYMGWKAVFVGDGSMHFAHKEKGEIRVYRKREVCPWMRECWDEFIKAANV